MDVFVARQPIFDRDLSVVAYELLYRKSEANYFDGSVSSNVATSVLLMNSYYSFGINNLIDSGKAFINFSRALIENDIPMLLSEHNVVIELLEDIRPDYFFMNKLRYIKSQGYTIALDDFVAADLESELLDLADIVKVDFILNTPEEVKKIFYKCKLMGKILLAEKVETNEVFLWSKKLGFDLFQGYFFSKPSIMKSKTVNDSVYQYIRLMEKLNMPEPDYKDIAGIIEVDVILTYKLLKLVNSRFGLVQNISSIQHALSILGISAFRKWLSLAIIQNNISQKTSELVKISMLRSHFMESIAQASILKQHVQEITLIGILSSVDVLLEIPMDVIVNSLPLSNAIKDTLLGRVSLYSDVLATVIAYEQGRFDDLIPHSANIHFDHNKLPTFYTESVRWAEDLFNYMQ